MVQYYYWTCSGLPGFWLWLEKKVLVVCSTEDKGQMSSYERRGVKILPLSGSQA